MAVEGEDTELPPNVKPLLKGFDDNIFANFILCPTHKNRPGEMGDVWIKSATKVVDRVVPYR